MKPGVRLHIERLVMDASLVRPGERARLQRAVENELSRLLTARGLADATASATPMVAAPSFPATPTSSVRTGEQIAHAVYGAIRTAA